MSRSWNKKQAGRRRVRGAMRSENMIKTKLSAHGVKVTVTALGQHWQFHYEDKCADWWPSTHRLVFDQHWGHSHTIAKPVTLLATLYDRWHLPKPN